jgi:GNAT superfamily N-acetyltransferase
MNSIKDQQPVFSHAEPVFPVVDVPETIRYWQEVLAFPDQWTWDDPPTIGAVSWHGAHIQFLKNEDRAKASAGNSVWIRVKYIDQLYRIHLERKAEIVEPLSSRPWGMDQYCVKDINGYYVAFAGHSADRKKSLAFPPNIVVVERKPTAQEFLAIQHSVGWTDSLNLDVLGQHLSAPVFGVVAIDSITNETIACALVISDNSSFYYIKDVMVKQEWQGKRIGTMIMKAVSDWIDRNGIKKSLVGLYTGENMEPFYSQFGFEKSFGMVKRV